MKIFILFLVIFVIYYSFNYYENFYSYGQEPEVFPIGSLSQEGASKESATVNISCDDINDSVISIEDYKKMEKKYSDKKYDSGYELNYENIRKQLYDDINDD